MFNELVNIWYNLFFTMAFQSFVIAVFLLVAIHIDKLKNTKILKWTIIIGTVKLFIPPFISLLIFTKNIKTEYIKLPEQVINLITTITITSENHFQLKNILFIAYLLIPTIIFSNAVYKFLKTKKVLKNSQLIQFNNCTIIKTDKIHSPFVFGFFFTKIIVPKNWDEFSNIEKKIIFDHEYSHVKNKDSLVSAISWLSIVAYFFNPLLWIVRKKLTLLLEVMADQQSSKHTSIKEYTQSLINIASNIGFQKNVRTLAFSSTYRRLKQRIDYIYQKKEESNMFSKKLKSCFSILGLILVILALSIKPSELFAGNKVKNKSEVTSKMEKVQVDKKQDEKGAVRDGAEGLERPVYDVVDLQKNAIFPDSLKKDRMGGMVILEVVLQKDGKIGKVKILKTLTEDADNSAITAVKKLKFTPGKLKGKPVDVIMVMTINFKLKSTEK